MPTSDFLTQYAVEALSRAVPTGRLSQEAVEVLQQPPGTQRMQVTQYAIEIPFPGPSVPPPIIPDIPPPTQGDITPTVCEPPPTATCTAAPDIRATTESCELLGS